VHPWHQPSCPMWQSSGVVGNKREWTAQTRPEIEGQFAATSASQERIEGAAKNHRAACTLPFERRWPDIELAARRWFSRVSRLADRRIAAVARIWLSNGRLNSP